MSHLYSQSGEGCGMPCKAIQEQSEQTGTVRGRFCSVEGDVPLDDCERVWLACLNNSVG